MTLAKYRQKEFESLLNEIVRDKMYLLLGNKNDLTIDMRYVALILKMLSYYSKDRTTLASALKEIHEIIG